MKEKIGIREERKMKENEKTIRNGSLFLQRAILHTGNPAHMYNEGGSEAIPCRLRLRGGISTCCYLPRYKNR